MKQDIVKIIFRILFYIVLTTMVLAFMMPFLYVIYTSLRSNGDILKNGVFAVADKVTFDNYIHVLTKAKFGKYLKTSTIITIPAVAGAMFVGSLAAYALAKIKFKGQRVIFFLILSCMYVPIQMLLVPIYRMYSIFGLTDSFLGIIILHITIAAPFCTFVLRNFFITVPNELQDAATIDGCNEFKKYALILLPLSLPALAVLAILQFTFIWNSFMIELILMTQNRPVMVGVANLQGEFVTDWAMQCTGAIIASIPTLITFLAFQKYFIGGLTVGGVKG